jgi:hypothetical protein
LASLIQTVFHQTRETGRAKGEDKDGNSQNVVYASTPAALKNRTWRIPQTFLSSHDAFSASDVFFSLPEEDVERIHQKVDSFYEKRMI